MDGREPLAINEVIPPGLDTVSGRPSAKQITTGLTLKAKGQNQLKL